VVIGCGVGLVRTVGAYIGRIKSRVKTLKRIHVFDKGKMVNKRVSSFQIIKANYGHIQQ